jgi:hypothetical protein
VVCGVISARVGVDGGPAQSMGFQGAMYTSTGASWSMTSLVGFGPAAHSPTLRRLWAVSALACAFLEF